MCYTKVCGNYIVHVLTTWRGIYEVWGEGGSYEECKEDVKSFIGVEKVSTFSVKLGCLFTVIETSGNFAFELLVVLRSAAVCWRVLQDLYDQCVRESFKINVESYGRKLVREYQQEVSLFVFWPFIDLLRKETSSSFSPLKEKWLWITHNIYFTSLKMLVSISHRLCLQGGSISQERHVEATLH